MSNEEFWVCPECGYKNPDTRRYCKACQCAKPEKKPFNFKLLAIILGSALFGIMLAIILISFLGKSAPAATTPTVTAEPSPTPTIIISTPEPTPESAVVTPAPQQGKAQSYDLLSILGPYPETEYGKSLKWYLESPGQQMSSNSKVNVIGNQFANRKDPKTKEYYSGNKGILSSGNSLGYPMSIYYADSVPYFVDVLQPGDTTKELVKLYYYGEELVGVRDYRLGKNSGDTLLLSDKEDLSAYKSEFAAVFDIAMKEYATH